MTEASHGLEAIRQLYEAYLEQVRQAEQTRRPFDGYMGFGPKLGGAPCHGQFARDLEALLQDLVRQEPDSAQAREMLELIYRAPQQHREPRAVYWMLLAVHALTAELIGRLDAEDAQTLLEEYKGLYGQRGLPPAQKKVLAALKASCSGRGRADRRI